MTLVKHPVTKRRESANCDWSTPQSLFDELDAEFGFTFDLCANHENAKCHRYFTKETDALAQSWLPGEVYWMNPPYGHGIGVWVERAYHASQRGATVVCLLPASVSTAWFHDYCQRGEVRFVRGRVKFGGAPWTAPFPSMVVVFRAPD